MVSPPNFNPHFQVSVYPSSRQLKAWVLSSLLRIKKESRLSSIRSKHWFRTAIKQSIGSGATSTAHSPSLVSPVFFATLLSKNSEIIGIGFRVHRLSTNPICNWNVYTRISNPSLFCQSGPGQYEWHKLVLIKRLSISNWRTTDWLTPEVKNDGSMSSYSPLADLYTLFLLGDTGSCLGYLRGLELRDCLPNVPDFTYHSVKCPFHLLGKRNLPVMRKQVPLSFVLLWENREYKVWNRIHLCGNIFR